MRLENLLRYVASLPLWLASSACYETASTEGLVCAVDDHCADGQRCVQGTCRLASSAPPGAVCSAQGVVDCGYAECYCPADSPFCCGDGRCYAQLDGCQAALGVGACPGGSDCSVCRTADATFDFCPEDAPYCCFEQGPAGDDIFCNADPDDPCG